MPHAPVAVPILWLDGKDSEDEADEDDAVPDPNDGGSERETAERSFLERKKRLGLRLRLSCLGLTFMSFMTENEKKPNEK